MKDEEKDVPFTLILELEDIFTLNRVFLAGFGSSEPRRISSLMAYGTIIDFPQLDKVYAEHVENNPKFTKRVLLRAINYWEYQGYLSPIPVILSAMIRRKIGVPKPEKSEENEEEE